MIKVFTLQQHSILIHFQANYEDGENVCLRASEVKPKLDRFLVKKLGGKDECQTQHKEWIRAEHPNGVDIALKYQMVITRNGGRPIIYEDLPNIYYGNLNNENKKYGVFFFGRLKLKIICFDTELFNYINANIAEFFAATNFGTMQDKGFGSFTVAGVKDNDVVKALKSSYGAKKCYVINTSSSGSDFAAQNELFKIIKQVYSVMKTGSRTPYYHSYLYTYMHSQKMGNIGNEKAHLKITKVSPALGRPHPDQKGINKYHYVRALLGIGEKVDYITDNPRDNWYELDSNGKILFQSNGAPITKFTNKKGNSIVTKEMREQVNIENVKDAKGTAFKKDEKGKIERLHSPIFFKIIDNKIYMVAGRVSEEIKGKFFSFTNSNEDALRKRGNTTEGKTVLQVPEIDFDIDDFIYQFVRFYNDTFLRNRDTRFGKKYSIVEVK